MSARRHYVVVDPAGREHVMFGAGPWFFALKLSVRRSPWAVLGGWKRRRTALLRARVFRSCEEFGPRNVRLMRGKPIVQMTIEESPTPAMPYELTPSKDLYLAETGGFHA